MYVPGFSRELQGGPARVALPLGGAQAVAPPMAVNPLDQVLARREQAETQLARAPADLRVAPRASGFASGILNSALAAAQPAATQPSAAQPAGLTFFTDRGRQAGYGRGSSGFVAFDPNAQYRLWDERGRNRIVSSGTGEAGLRAIHEMANQLNSAGKKANWGVERLDPATGRWVRILENDPGKNVLGKIADIALPVAGAFLLPGVGGALGGALGAGLGAAGGSALSSVAQGRPLGDTLLRAGLSGVAAGGLSAIGGTPFIPGGGPASAAGGVAGGAAGATGSAGMQAVGRAAQGALGSALGSTATNIVVPGVVGAGLGAGIGAGVGAAGGAALGAALGGSGGAQNITVEGTRPQVTTPPAALPPLATVPTTAGGTYGNSQPTDAGDDGKIDVDDIIRYLRAGSLGVGVLGSLFGGGGRPQTAGTIPGGFGGMNPVFSGALPAATMPGASSNFAQRPANFDWKRYGYGPGQSFFDYAPQGQPNTSMAYTGYAEGGVAGAGTGRSDEIPALLSDGEYIIDAETVALLGDGSTKAGAERLDAFRVNIRKHKGRQLAKGGFSHDAKPPEQYLQGGLT